MNEQIIDPVPLELIKAEMTPDRFLRKTNKGGNEIYVVTAHNAPNIMRELGRLREIAFRAAGGGTGKSVDIDRFDTMENPCRQLFVWDPDAELILGGYRYIRGRDMTFDADGRPQIAISHIFELSDKFISNYLPYTIELGRSFVRPEYQSSKAGAKAIYALDNLWDGLGALTCIFPEVKYLFGKVTMYPSYHRQCRDLILYFLNRYFPDHENLVRPIKPLESHPDLKTMESMFHGNDFRGDFKILNNEVRAHGINIPPLVHAYMSLSPTMRMFGTAINDEFGDVEETGIFLAIDEILEEKKQRHIDTYKPLI
ncbi:MAG: GNAT family N-acetyltransferase [Muribaculaceae bacterium]|nr:GNAT family N-acetyltransferase [Muribaculaceae bacterium]